MAEGETQPKYKIPFRIAVCLTERLVSFFSLNSHCVKSSAFTIVRDNYKNLTWRETTINKF